MHVFELTRKMIDIESITPNEGAMGDFLHQHLGAIAAQWDGQIERMPVETGRDNIFVRFGNPVAVLSTHMDTVPPFLPSREDDERIWGRGACDTKGIIAAMIGAAERLLQSGKRDFGLLFVVGEERNSAGALKAATQGRGSRFLINGEPTENRLAMASKGALRFHVVARGRMAHSAYPELGESAVLKLLNALDRIRQVALPADQLLGPSTLNIATLEGGRAPNVIPDYAASEIFVRIVGDVSGLRASIPAAAKPDAEATEVLYIPAVRFGSLSGFETCVVAFTTDVPAFAGAWGEPYLLGPGSIHVAHTDDEHISKQALLDAIGIYAEMVVRLTR